jgi:uncharacterized BrkB/YihY/UPF0761 family membrane protein
VGAAALLAAVFAHVAIDVLGDYLVRDDTYDHVAHGSRELLTLIAFGIAASAGALFFSRLCTAAASIRTRVRMLRVTRAQLLLAFAAIAAIALVLVPSMEGFDALRAGQDIDDLGDLFGGSLLLGISTTLACAALCSAFIAALGAWLARHRERVASLIGAFLTARRPRPAGIRLRYAPAKTPAMHPARAMKRRSKRGPPQTALVPFLLH